MRYLAWTALLSSASSTVLLSVLPGDSLKRGRSYDVDYLLDRPYHLRLELVRKGTQTDIAWTSVKILFEDVDGVPCKGNYTAMVDDTWPTSEAGEWYALWISGLEYNGTAGYADLTDWFRIDKF